MGHSREYRCTSCNLNATVSAGFDRGFAVLTETQYCPTCQSLADVSILLWCEDRLPGLLPKDQVEELLRRQKTEFGKCMKCNNPDGVPWTAGEPCPRCKGKIEPVEGGEYSQWF